MNKKKLVLSSLAVGVAVVVVGAGGASAAKLVGSSDIRDGAVHRVDLSDGVKKALDTNGKNGKNGVDGKAGKDGVDGKDGVSGLYYRTAVYGATSATDPLASVNAGAIATAACDSPADTAVAGGVQTLGLDGHPAAVASSFPGRMDWTTNTPKTGRLDGWIIQFDAQTAPDKANIWVLCAKDTSIARTLVPVS